MFPANLQAAVDFLEGHKGEESIFQTDVPSNNHAHNEDKRMTAEHEQRPGRTKEGVLADFAGVRDENNGDLIGLWLRDISDANDRDVLGSFLIRRGAPEIMLCNLFLGAYRVVPNNYDDSGGCFVMFDNKLAPGE